MNHLDVLFEDNHLLIVNKPAGMLSQGDNTGDRTVLDWGKEYLKEKYNKPGNVFLGCVHRLDRPVSGIIVMARTSKALSRLNEQFKGRRVNKTYWATVENKPVPEAGELKHFIIKDQKKNIVSTYNQPKAGAKEAVLQYQLLKKIHSNYLLEIKPLTGRPHQIRAQLASIGCSIIGDLKYKSKRAWNNGNIMLHACQINIQHPVKKEMMTINCEPANDWGM